MSERLIIRKLSPKTSLAGNVAERVMQRPVTKQVVLDEVAVNRPFRFSLLRRNKAGLNDKRAIKVAVESMRTSLAEDASRFEVVRVKDEKKPKEKKMRAWQRSVNRERKRGIHKLQKQEGKRTDRSVATEVKIHAVETKDLIAVGDREEAKGKAKMLTAIALGTAHAVIPHRMKPGKSESRMQASMYGIYSRLQDGVLDPLNVFHGFGEALTDKIKQIQTGSYRTLFNIFLAANPRLNQAVAVTLNLNKLTSRDTISSKIYVAAYSAFYERITDNKKTFLALPKFPLLGKVKVTRGEAWAAFLPSPAQVENAADDHMEFTDKASAIQAHDVLSSPVNTRYGRLYQRDMAHAVLGSLNTVPLDNKLIHSLEQQMGKLTTKVNSVTGGRLSKIPNPFPKIMEFAGLKKKTPKKKKGEAPTEAEVAQAAAIAAASNARKQVEKALKEPMSIIDYTRVMLQLSQVYLTLPNLQPIERVKWTQASQWGSYVVDTYNVAEQVTQQRRTAAENAPTEAAAPVATPNEPSQEATTPPQAVA